MPGVGVLQRLVEDGHAVGQLLGERLGDEGGAGGEVPVKGGGADSGPAGDRGERHIDAPARERLTGGFEDALAIVPGIGA